MYRISRQITLHNRCFFSTLRKDPKAIKKSYRLTPQQKKFVERESLEDCKLLGTSGSGKTLSILHRVKHLIEERAYNPEEFHILTFSRLTKLDIMNKIQFHDFSNLPSDNVRTMDALARTVLKDLDRNYQDAALLSLNFLNLLEHEFDVARPYLENLKYMFLDEAQDLRDAHIRIVNILREKNNSKVCVVGDPCQSIYQFLGCDPSFLINFPGETFQLTKNFRSTPNIIGFSEHFRKKDVFEYPIEHAEAMDDNTENITTKRQRKKREVEIYIGTSKQVEKKILREISKYTKDKSNIGILSPLAKSKFSDNIGLSWAANLLTKNRIPFIKQYKDSGMPWKGDPYTKPDYVNMTTYTGSKGLEWDFVILLDFSLFKHGSLPTQKEYLEDLNLYYVAATRAKKRLLICHKTDTGLNDEVLQTNDGPSIELKPAEPSIDVKDILSQFKDAAQPLKTMQESHIENLREEKSEEDEEEEELVNGNMRIVRNMPHPLIKTVDPELYESTEKTKSQIKRLKFDITWLEKEKRIEGPLTVSEFVSSLDKDKIGSLFQNPQFGVQHEKESVYDKTDMNLAAIQNNEALGGIISENLLYRYLGLPVRDLTDVLAKQNYTIHYHHKKYVNPLGENSSADTDNKTVYDEFSLIGGHDQFSKHLYVSPSTHRAILNSLKSIKEVNSYKDPKAEQNALENKDNDYKADFHTIFNSILQYAFTSKHNHYIIWAWKSTERFIHDNTQYINNIRMLAKNLLQRSVFWQTQVELFYSSVLNGLADLVDNESHIYEIKATKNTTRNHILQAFLYSVMSSQKRSRENQDINCKSSLINLIHGEIHHYNFTVPQHVLDDFLETTLNKSARMLNGTLYLYKIKMHKTEDRLYIYHLWIKDAKAQNNIIDTYIKYPNFMPPLDTEEEMDHYMRAPTRTAVEHYLEQLVVKQKKPIFLSVPGCDETGDGLGSLLPASSTIIGGEGFLKLVLSGLPGDRDHKEDKEPKIPNELDDDKFLVMSGLAFRNLNLLKDYIDEYCISFYL